ncbi:MAG TPA: family 43 glycosylhydrolase [Ignavibacteriaceae bacterium]|nr:family 43 glycosylhydrolase [Ignavibacteriaceae bacterium]
MNVTIILYSFFLSFLLLSVTNSQKLQSDNGDGTYTNPVIYSDFPDPDVIRVDSVYYMVSTTMFIFPGVTILKSYDLVNWEYCSNAVQRMDFSQCYNLNGCNRYSHGQWATSLKYKNGRYYLLFITLDEGGFIVTATNPEGPWQIKKLPRGFYDPGLFFDDDGKIYVAFGYNNISVTELDSNFTAKSSDVLVFTGDIRSGLEGTHVYKINGYYYLYCTYGGGDGFQVALRSTNIYGPYEEKIVIRDNGNLGTGIHQGALIETQTGEWWSVIFQDGGAFGRFPTLQPVTWVDDWPMVGVNGKGVITYQKPNVGKEYPITTLPTSDEFDSTNLGLQWGWNHNPDPAKWSLTQNPGFLRLSTNKVVSNLRDAQNTLTQRIFAYYSRTLPTSAVVKMKIDSMVNGDIAGLAVFQDPYAFIGVKKVDTLKYVVMVNNGKTIDSALINTSTIYLKAQANYGTSRASFGYSIDNSLYKKIGNNLSMQFNLSVFTGNKFCLFNFATVGIDGFVDFDWFRIDWSPITDVDHGDKLNDSNIPDKFFLEQNYPNPFNPVTTINYGVPEESFVNLSVYDILGRKVKTIVNNPQPSGSYSEIFNAAGMSSGLYFYSLQTGKQLTSKKMMLIK